MKKLSFSLLKWIYGILFVFLLFAWKDPHNPRSKFYPGYGWNFKINEYKYTPPPTFTQKDTTLTVATGITWKMTFRAPDNLFSRNGIDSGQVIIFFPGLGEANTNAYGNTSMTKYGPLDYVEAGWDGGVVLGNGTHYPILIHIIQQGPTPCSGVEKIDAAIQQIISRFRIKTHNGKKLIHLTGLSAGGYTAKINVMQDTYSTTGPWPAASRVTSIVDVQGMKPDCQMSGVGYDKWIENYARAGGRMVSFEGSNDGRDHQTVINRMNSVVANSGIYYQLTSSNSPMSTHCCWNFLYGGNGSGTNYTPAVVNFDGKNQTIYQWMLRQAGSDTAISAGGSNPVAQAGADQSFFKTRTTTTLDGSASADDGTITIYSWTKISGPNTPTFGTPSNAITTVSGLVQGGYVFRLTVTDNDNNTATDDIQIFVEGPPTVNAGIDQNVTSSSATLAGSGTDDKTISRYSVTKMWIPTLPKRRIGIVGSSTGVGYGSRSSETTNGQDSTAARFLKDYYKGLGVIDTVINLSVTSTDFYYGRADNTPAAVGKPAIDTAHNLNALKRRGVTDVIWMYTTNGMDSYSIAEAMDQYRKARDTVLSWGMTFHCITPKSREGFSPSEELKLWELTDSIILQMPNHYIHAWYGMVKLGTTDTRDEFDLNDGVHFNSNGQYQLYLNIVARNIFRNVVSNSATITNSALPTTTVTGLTNGTYWFQIAAIDNDSLMNSDIVALTVNITAASNCRVGTPQSFVLSKTDVPAGDLYDPNGNQYLSHKGYDTLKLPAGTYSLISLGKINGDVGCPVVIVNSGGQVVAEQIRLGEFVTSPVDYVKVIGIATPGTYGIKVSNDYSKNGFNASFFKHLEITNVEVTHAAVGFYLKPIPSESNSAANYPAWQGTGLYVHHTYVHDVGGEGMYVGDTYPEGDPYVGGVIPARLDSVELAFNTVDGTDWDGIQLSNARNGAKIHDNIVKDAGRIDNYSQGHALILGGNTSGDVYNNTVIKSKGNGLLVHGYGTVNVYGNSWDSTGQTAENVNGDRVIYSNDFPTMPEGTLPKLVLNIHDNIIKNPKPRGILYTQADNGGSDSLYFVNNQVCLGSLSSVNWGTVYFNVGQANYVNTGNVLITCSPSIFNGFIKMLRGRRIRFQP